MAFPQRLKDLCAPALFYFVISMIAIFVLLLQNIGGSHTRYHVANFSCIVPSTIIIFILKINRFRKQSICSNFFRLNDIVKISKK